MFSKVFFSYFLLLGCSMAATSKRRVNFEDVNLGDFEMEPVLNEDELDSNFGSANREFKKPEQDLKEEETDKERTKQIQEDSPRAQQTKSEVIAKLGKVKNVEDFIRVFKVKGITTDLKKELQDSIRTINDNSLECKPRPTTFTVPNPEGDMVVYYPSCVKRQKCNGCCSDRKRHCVSASTTVEKRRIMKIDVRVGGPKMSSVTVDVIHDKTCSCGCKKTGCGPNQTFDKQYCSCKCSRRPQLCPQNLAWSTIKCGCVCNHPGKCPSNYKFDKPTCTCKQKLRILQGRSIETPYQ